MSCGVQDGWFGPMSAEECAAWCDNHFVHRTEDNSTCQCLLSARCTSLILDIGAGYYEVTTGLIGSCWAQLYLADGLAGFTAVLPLGTHSGKADLGPLEGQVASVNILGDGNNGTGCMASFFQFANQTGAVAALAAGVYNTSDLVARGIGPRSTGGPGIGLVRVEVVWPQQGGASSRCSSGETSAAYGMPDELYFDGTNTTTIPMILRDAFTIAFQFKTNATFGNYTHSNGAIAYTKGAGILNADLFDPGQDFGVSIGAGRVMFGTAWPEASLVTSKEYNDGHWHTVVITRSLGAMTLRVDNFSSSRTYNNTPLTPQPNITLGKFATHGAAEFEGSLRRICIRMGVPYTVDTWLALYAAADAPGGVPPCKVMDQPTCQLLSTQAGGGLSGVQRAYQLSPAGPPGTSACTVLSTCGVLTQVSSWGTSGWTAYARPVQAFVPVALKVTYLPTGICMRAGGGTTAGAPPVNDGYVTRACYADGVPEQAWQTFQLPWYNEEGQISLVEGGLCLGVRNNQQAAGGPLIVNRCGSDTVWAWGTDHLVRWTYDRTFCVSAGSTLGDWMTIQICNAANAKQHIRPDAFDGKTSTTTTTVITSPVSSTTSTSTLSTTSSSATRTSSTTTSMTSSSSVSSSSTTSTSTTTVSTSSTTTSSATSSASTTATTSTTSSSALTATTTTSTSTSLTSSSTSSATSTTSTSSGTTSSTATRRTTTTTTTPPPLVALSPSPPLCEDQASFRDARGLSCEDWQGQNCSALPQGAGYDLAGLAAVQAGCPRSCGACAGSAAARPSIVIQPAKQVAFGVEVAADLSGLSQDAREGALKLGVSAVLGVDPSSVASVTVLQLSARRLGAGQQTYRVTCQVVVPPSVQARTIITQLTSLGDPASGSFGALASGLAGAGVDTTGMAAAVTARPVVSTVSVAVGGDGTITGVAAAPAGSSSGGSNSTDAGGAAPPAPSRTVITPGCADSQEFVDEQGEGCSGWVGYACDSVAWLRTEKPYTVKGLLSVQGHCPLSCGACSPPGRPSPSDLASRCADDVYIGAWCRRWRGMTCSEATRLGYSDDYQRLLQSRCPLSCGLCGNGAPALLDIAGFIDELGYNCSAWRGSDCTQMHANYTRKGMLTVQTACQDSCFASGAPRRLLAPTCQDDPDFSYVGEFTCSDFIGRICTYATFYLNVRWLLGPRGSLAWHEDVWSHCPAACGLCEPKGGPTPADLLTECQDDPAIQDWCTLKWASQGCLHWNRSLTLVVPHEQEHFNETLLGRCPATCRLCEPPVCRAGTYRDTRRHVCTDCSVGTYMPTNSSGPAALACTAARPGFAVPGTGATKEEPCALGTFAASAGQPQCDACQPGRYAPDRAVENCTACLAGWFQASSGASACRRCPTGTYAEGAGQTACTACPPALSTLLEAAASPAACGCPAGQWRPLGAVACAACPPGLQCPGGHSQFDPGPDRTALLPPGMMSLPEDVSSVYTCTGLVEDCPGYRPLPYSPDELQNVCPNNRIGPRCSRCPKGYFHTPDGTCESCSEAAGAAGKVLSILAAFALSVYATESCYRSCQRFRSEGQFLFFALVGSLQGMVPVIHMPLKWPWVFYIPFRLVAPFSLPGLWSLWRFDFHFKCLVGESLMAETIKNVSLPILPFFNMAVLYFVFPLTCRRLDRATAMGCVATIWDGLWIALCVMAIMLFPTDTMPNGKHFLRYIPDVEVGSLDWLAVLPLGLGSILLYVCTFLAYTIVGVCNAPRLVVEREGYLDQYTYIVYVYAPEAYWWGLALYVSNFTLTLIQVFADVNVQIYASVFLLVAMLLLELYVRPSVFPRLNDVHVALKGATAAFTILGVCLVDDAKAVAGKASQVIMGIGVAVLLVLVLAVGHSVSRGVVGRRRWAAVRNLTAVRRARAVMSMVTVMPDTKFLAALQNITQPDVDRLLEANRLLAGVFLRAHCSRQWWRQRLIPGAADEILDVGLASARADELVCRHRLHPAMEANVGFHRLLDHVQEATLPQTPALQKLDPRAQPVAAAVAACSARLAADAKACAGFRACLLAGQQGPDPALLQQAEKHGEVSISCQHFLDEFGGRGGLAQQALLRLHGSLDYEGAGEVPLSRIVALLLTHTKTGLEDEDDRVADTREFEADAIAGEPHARQRPALAPRIMIWDAREAARGAPSAGGQ